MSDARENMSIDATHNSRRRMIDTFLNAEPKAFSLQINLVAYLRKFSSVQLCVSISCMSLKAGALLRLNWHCCLQKLLSKLHSIGPCIMANP